MGDVHWFSICNWCSLRYPTGKLTGHVFFALHGTRMYTLDTWKIFYYPTEYGRKVYLRLSKVGLDWTRQVLASDWVFGQGAMRRARRRTLAEGPIKIHGPFLVHYAKQRAMGTVLEIHGEICEKRNAGLRETTRNPCAMGAAGIFGTTLAWKFAHPLGFVWLTAKVSQHMLLSC